MMVKIGGRWINPEQITHLTESMGDTRVHFRGGTHTDIPRASADEVVRALVRGVGP